jgi:hypothetical protein
MVIAQAQKVALEGDTLTFTFAPVHKPLRGQLEAKRSWLEQLAQSAVGRRVAVVAKQGEAAPAVPNPDVAARSARRADLEAKARAEPSVQAVLDVFGGEIEDVEEIQ